MLSQNALIDIFDRLGGQFDPDKRWDVAQCIAADMGVTGMNLSLLGRRDQIIHGYRTSMSEAWQDEYIGENYMSVDPFVTGISKSNDLMLYQPGAASFDDTSRLGKQMNHGFLDAGYRTMVGLPSNGALPELCKFVALCTEMSPDDRFFDQHVGELKVLGGLIKAFVDTGETGIQRGALTPRETEVLRLLALGNQNKSIAYQLDIAEVTVRSHITSVRRKLGAKTREHAIALAITKDLISL